LAADVGAVWWRQFELAPTGTNTQAAAIDELLLVRAQWRTWLASLSVPAVPWVNDLWAGRQAENKLLQLRLATELGFSVPRTVVTNDPCEAQRTLGDCEAVVKTLASAYFELSGGGFVYTQAFDDVVSTDAWFAQPLMVPQQIRGDDVRVILVGKDCFGASCATTTLDWRTAGQNAVWSGWAVPGMLADKCRAYIARTGLQYAAFDFIDSGDGVWFLEANQAGEWAFLERVLHLGISESLAGLLSALGGWCLSRA
jgi:glutathione synthase/RimK-type ligase-like ATP-grasp enzyme